MNGLWYNWRNPLFPPCFIDKKTEVYLEMNFLWGEIPLPCMFLCIARISYSVFRKKWARQAGRQAGRLIKY